MKNTWVRRPQSEGLESKLMLTGGGTFPAPLPPVIIGAPPLPVARHMSVDGVAHGVLTRHSGAAGVTFDLKGVGMFGETGAMTVSGSVGSRTGHITLSDAHGSVTLALTAPATSSAATEAGHYHFAITAGTGSYQGVGGDGVVDLTMAPSPSTTDPGGTFTMTFHDGPTTE